MKRPVIAAVVVVVVVVAVAAVGYLIWSQQQEPDATLVLAGTVDADEVQVSTIVGGTVVSARVDEGDAVERGQIVYKLDPRALELQVEQAQAGVDAARAAFRQAEDDDESDADIAAARARLDQAKAAEQLARVQLSYATITAPTTGTVTTVAITKGETASPGRTLATIAKDGSLFVRAYVPEPRIADVAVGTRATITSDSGASVDGEVTFVSSRAEFTPSNVETPDQRAALVYEIRLRPDEVGDLIPGMPVDVTIE